MVSVVITTWNAADYLRETLESVFAQTYTSLEVIVVDDGSTDHTRDVCASFGGKLSYIYQAKDNKGGSTAIPKAYAAARGVYIATLDHDDRWLPEKIERQVEIMEANQHVGVLFTRFRIIDAQGRDRGLSPLAGPSGNVFHTLLAGNRYCYASALIRRAALEHVGPQQPFEDGIGLGDWDLWLRIARHYPVILMDDALTEYRVHDRSYSADRRRMAVATVRVLDRHRSNLHPGCHECSAAFRQGLLLAAQAYLEDFHTNIRSGHWSAAMPSLRDGLTLSRVSGLRIRQVLAIVKSFLMAMTQPLRRVQHQ